MFKFRKLKILLKYGVPELSPTLTIYCIEMALLGRWSLTIIFAVVSVLIGGPLVFRWLAVEQRLFALRIQMLVVIECILFVGTRYVWIRLQKLLYSCRRQTIVIKLCSLNLKLITALVLLLSHLSFIINYFIYAPEPSLLSICCFVCLGAFIQFFISYFCLNCLFLLTDWTRCLFLGYGRVKYNISFDWINFLASVLFSIAISVYGVYGGARVPIVKTVEVPVKGLASSWDRTSIVAISDIHLGPTVGQSKLQQIVTIVNELKPDVVVLIGDLTDGTVDRIGAAALPLRDIKAKHGKYFVSGNHDYYTGDIENWYDHVRMLGFSVLHNSNVNISDRQGNSFCLAGCADIAGQFIRHPDHGMNLDKAVGSCDSGRPIILLAHQPRAAQQALSSSYNIQLVLSGHTHGGQMFPMVIFAYLVNPFFAGLYHYNGGYVYVTQGAVYWGIPMRVFSESEITRIFLHSSSVIST